MGFPMPRSARASSAFLRVDDTSCVDDSCLVPETEHAQPATGRLSLAAYPKIEFPRAELFDIALLAAPVLLPMLSFYYFDDAVNGFHDFLDFVSNLKWVQVDGGVSKAATLLPVMNGNVLPSVSFALGTLTATTISGLRQRQISLRAELNAEACALRSLHSAVEVLFPLEHCENERMRATLLLRQYCTRVLIECRAGINLNRLERQGAANSELDGLTRLLHQAPQLDKGHDFDSPRFYGTTEFFAQIFVKDLQIARSNRLATLQTTFPAVHWMVLGLLGTSIIIAFLIAADQDLLRFLASLQLRLLFSVLTGALVATACVCIDLNDPFRGAFRITPSSEQLVNIRDEIEQSLQKAARGEEYHE